MSPWTIVGAVGVRPKPLRGHTGARYRGARRIRLELAPTSWSGRSFARLGRLTESARSRCADAIITAARRGIRGTGGWIGVFRAHFQLFAPKLLCVVGIWVR